MSSNGADGGTVGGLRWWRRSLHLRLTGMLVLVVALVLLAVGVVLYKALQARLIAHDHALLERKARWVVEGDAGRFQDRLDALAAMWPDLRVVAGADGSVSEALVHTVTLDGQAFDVLDLAVRGDGNPAAERRLMAPAAPREATLRRIGRVILAAGLAGVLAAVFLSAHAMRWSTRRLRRLSREALVASEGGRLSTSHADAELLELVEAFNSTLDQLENACRQSEAFSADVAHELRSPLATLIGGTQLALSRPRTGEELRDALASNLEELERLKKLVNDMLFLARADRGERAQSLERADLGALADSMIDYCGALLDEAGLSAARIGAATAVCNEALIRRAMANLLSNAIRHAQEGSRVELRLDALPGKVRIGVFNTGAPIARDVADRMFNRFFRASASRADHSAHHGLGLAIVHAVARMHGGSVFVQAGEGGNTVGFDIPGALASAQVRVRDAVHEAPR